MINDLADLEPVLDQYDTEKILIGPLLNLSINSSFRFFYIAGKGSKIYESVALGFVDVESDAQRQRADIVAQMQKRFGAVKLLDNQLELAREAHNLWSTEETARFLATAALESNLQLSTAVSRNESSENGSDSGAVRTDSGKQLDREPRRPTLMEAIAATSARASSSGCDQAQLMALHPAPAAQPVTLPNTYDSWP